MKTERISMTNLSSWKQLATIQNGTVLYGEGYKPDIVNWEKLALKSKRHVYLKFLKNVFNKPLFFGDRSREKIKKIILRLMIEITIVDWKPTKLNKNTQAFQWNMCISIVNNLKSKSDCKN